MPNRASPASTNANEEKHHAASDFGAFRHEAGQPSILLVPEQFTSSTEGRIYRELGDGLSAWVSSYSFSSLAEKLLDEYGGAAVRTVTDAARVVLVRRAVEALGPRVTYYGRHRRSPVFLQKCA